jgi:hypothetical protein
MHHRLRAGLSIERLYRDARLKRALERPPTVQYVTIVPDPLPGHVGASSGTIRSRRRSTVNQPTQPVMASASLA